MSRPILAFDQGTTSRRAIVFDGRGHIKVAQTAFRQIFPQSGWGERDAMEIRASQMGVAHEDLA